MSRVDDCSTWLLNKQLQLAGLDFGSNKTAVSESLEDHKKLFAAVQSFNKEIDKLTPQEAGGVKESHKNLIGLATQQNHCLEMLLELQSIEEVVGNLTNEIVLKSVTLSDKLQRIQTTRVAQSQATSKLNAYQNCILSLKGNWEWLNLLLKCSEQQLIDAGAYHQFCHLVHEYSQWMPADLERTKDLLDVAQIRTSPHGATINRLLREIKSAIAIFIRWQNRLDSLLHQVKDVPPVHLRTTRATTPIPAFALATYTTKRANLQCGEEVMLLDNSGAQVWKVKTAKGDVIEVPSVILRIPAPDNDLLQKAMKLILELLGTWTSVVKKYGKTIVFFLLHVIKIWSPDEEKLLIDMSPNDKQLVKRLLGLIEKTFSQHWGAYPPYEELQRRISHLRVLINQDSSGKPSQGNGSLLIIQTHLLEELLFNYREFWKQWETYKILSERLKHPECLLSVSNWRQYHFLQLSDWLKTWQASLDFDESDYDDYGRTLVEEQIQVERERKSATTSQMFSSEQEENQTFTITGVIDPVTQEQISLDQAVAKGIINQTEGRYIINTKTGESIPIPVAMNAGKIKVELVKVKKSEEKIKDIGLIDIKMVKETRPYKLTGVRDPRKNDIISLEEAAKRGILNQKQNTYRDLVTGNTLTLAEALDSGLLLVDFLSEADSHSEPLIESKTYMVNGVVDRKTQRVCTFSEAVREGLINPDNGSYNDTLAGKEIYIGDAIREGYVKAIVVKDTSSLNIDPSNKISVDEDKLHSFKQAIISLIKF